MSAGGTRPAYPGLGFDPTPGEPSAVVAVLDGLDETRRLLADCAADVPPAPAGWTGAAADAYSASTAALPAALADTGTSMATAARVLTTWLGRLVAGKRETERLDALARQLHAALTTAREPARTELAARLDRTISDAVRLRARHLRHAVEAALSLDGGPPPGWPAPVVEAVAHTSGEVGDWTAYLARFGSAALPADDTEVPALAEVPDAATVLATVVAVPLDQPRPLGDPRPVPPTDTTTVAAATTPAADARPRTARRGPDGPHETDARRPASSRRDTPTDSPRATADRAGPSRTPAPAAAGPRHLRPPNPLDQDVPPRSASRDMDRVTTASANPEPAQPMAEQPRTGSPEPRPTAVAEPARSGEPPRHTGGEPRLVAADPGQRGPAATPPPAKSARSDAGEAALLLTTTGRHGAVLALDADPVVRRTTRLGTYLLCSGDQQVLVLTEEHGTVVRRAVCLPAV